MQKRKEKDIRAVRGHIICRAPQISDSLGKGIGVGVKARVRILRYDDGVVLQVAERVRGRGARDRLGFGGRITFDQDSAVTGAGGFEKGEEFVPDGEPGCGVHSVHGNSIGRFQPTFRAEGVAGTIPLVIWQRCGPVGGRADSEYRSKCGSAFCGGSNVEWDCYNSRGVRRRAECCVVEINLHFGLEVEIVDSRHHSFDFIRSENQRARPSGVVGGGDRVGVDRGRSDDTEIRPRASHCPP